MKIQNIYRKTIIAAFLAFTTIAGTLSCGNNEKNEDSKDIAMDHNDAKYNNTKSEKDSKFLVDAASIDLEEIQLGQLAAQNGNAGEVKGLGKMMETDHTQNLNDLKALAAKKLITIPSTPTSEAMDAYNNLSQKSGSDFDKVFCDMMVKGHKDAISKFETASKDCDDADIRGWASATLPALRTHLDHSLTCQKDIK